MNVIVVGGGKVGYYLAETLLEHDHKPFVIETDKEICRKIANNLDIPVINGDGTTRKLWRAPVWSTAKPLSASPARTRST